MRPTRSTLLSIAIAAALLVAGCGSATTGPAHPRSASAAGSPRSGHPVPAPGPVPGAPSGPGAPLGPSPHSIPAPAPTGAAADPAALKVIRGWSSTLLRGDVSDAARYFALPSRMINGVGAGGEVAVITIRTEREAQAANETLSCGAKFISADQRGRFVNALFRLINRPGPGGGCGPGVGLTARTNFVIAGGRIVEWIRAPDDPGDNPGSGAPGTPAPSAPPGPTTPSAPSIPPVVA
ncbi:MAG: hypothetical protein ACR2LV_00215 [Solirubrobacteraceae bacterium]